MEFPLDTPNDEAVLNRERLMAAMQRIEEREKRSLDKDQETGLPRASIVLIGHVANQHGLVAPDPPTLDFVLQLHRGAFYRAKHLYWAIQYIEQWMVRERDRCPGSLRSEEIQTWLKGRPEDLDPKPEIDPLERPKFEKRPKHFLTRKWAESRRAATIAKAEETYARRIAKIEAAEADLANVAKGGELNQAIQARKAKLKKILELRAAGLTYRKIGESIGVSHHRISQLIAEADHKERSGYWDKPRASLSVRASNCLAQDLGRDFTPKEVAKLYTVRSLSRLPNLGHKSAAEIVAWLRHHGFELPES